MAHNVSESLDDAEKTCISCSACLHRCSHEAISFVSTDAGFSRIVIDESKCTNCGDCTKVCPQLNRPKEETAPKCYAGLEDNRDNVFHALSKWIVENGSYVSGALADKDLKIRYHATNDLQSALQMTFSPCFFSEMDGIFVDIESLLESGSKVLFIGRPCHVQAIKNYIGENANLYTADILCDGQPSPSICSNYLREVSGNNTISTLECNSEDKSSTLNIVFSDGSKKESNKDPYVRAYKKHLAIDGACQSCNYSDHPRTGDITIGRCKVHIESDSENREVIIVNSEKGMHLLNGIIDSGYRIEECPMPSTADVPGMRKERPLHPGSKRMKDMLGRGHPVSKAADYCLGRKYDVGITGFWRVVNYGGVLTYYALYNIILDMGLEPLMIESRKESANQPLPPNPKLYKAGYPDYSIAPWYHSKEEEEELNSRVKNFVVGSDQVWNRKFISQNSIECYALDFVHEDRNKVSISSSFGTDKFEGNESEKESFARLLRRFNHVSVREESAVEICTELGVEASVIIDPVMICDMKHYEELAEKSNMVVPELYVFNYMMHPGIFTGMEAVYKALGYGPITISNAGVNVNERIPYPRTNIGSVENWLKCIMNSSFVLTDSFHGTVFSILLKKPFVTLIGSWGNESGVDRMITLLKWLGLEDRMYRTPHDALKSGVLNRNIDYESIHQILNERRKASMNWIRNALETDRFSNPEGASPRTNQTRLSIIHLIESLRLESRISQTPS